MYFTCTLAKPVWSVSETNACSRGQRSTVFLSTPNDSAVGNDQVHLLGGWVEHARMMRMRRCECDVIVDGSRDSSFHSSALRTVVSTGFTVRRFD